jgi:hypothetical protein
MKARIFPGYFKIINIPVVGKENVCRKLYPILSMESVNVIVELTSAL